MTFLSDKELKQKATVIKLMKDLGATDEEIKEGCVYLGYDVAEQKYYLIRGSSGTFGVLN